MNVDKDERDWQEWFDSELNTPEAIAEGLALDFIRDIEKRRAVLGLSYAELARRMGVSRAYMSKLMSGTQNSTLGSLVRLALVLGCEVKLGLRTQHAPALASLPEGSGAKTPGRSRRRIA